MKRLIFIVALMMLSVVCFGQFTREVDDTTQLYYYPQGSLTKCAVCGKELYIENSRTAGCAYDFEIEYAKTPGLARYICSECNKLIFGEYEKMLDIFFAAMKKKYKDVTVQNLRNKKIDAVKKQIEILKSKVAELEANK